MMTNNDTNAPETEDDAEEIGRLRLARWGNQNAQLLGKKARRDEKAPPKLVGLTVILKLRSSG